MFSLVHQYRSKYPVSEMCKILNVSRSGYYQWAKREDSEHKKRRHKLQQLIHRAFLDSRRLYGSPKIKQVLRQQGVQVSEKTVARLMKELGLKSRTVKKYKATTNSKHNLPVHENILNQQFAAQRRLNSSFRSRNSNTNRLICLRSRTCKEVTLFHWIIRFPEYGPWRFTNQIFEILLYALVFL